MAGPWITNAELKTKVLSMLKRTTLESYWDDLIAASNTDAVSDIMDILLNKGFTAGQIDQWDNRVTYNRDIALYHTFVKAAGLGGYSQESIDKLDRRKMLAEAGSLMVGGKVVEPGADDGAGSETGVIDDSDYRINMDTRF